MATNDSMLLPDLGTRLLHQCNSCTSTTPDASIINAIVSTFFTTTIRVEHILLKLGKSLIYHVYKPLGRTVAIIDDKVEKYFGADLYCYFGSNGIELINSSTATVVRRWAMTSTTWSISLLTSGFLA